MAEEIFEREFKLKMGELYTSEGRSRVESDMILPDYKEEAHRIVRADAKPRVNQKTVSYQGQNLVCEIEGVVSFHILYQSDRHGEKGVLSSFMSQENFSYTFKVPFSSDEIDPESVVVFAELVPENVSAKLFGPRKISARCDVKIGVDLKCNRRVALFPDRFPSDIKTRKKSIKMAKLVRCFQSEESFTETIALPKEYLPVSQICEMGAGFFAQNVAVEEGGVRFSVLCDLDCSYVTEGEENLVSFYQPIEFDKSIGLEEAKASHFAKVSLFPNFLKALPDINEDGENRNIVFEIGYTLEILLFVNEECDAIEDAFSLDTDLLLESKHEVCEEILSIKDFNITIKDEIAKTDFELFRVEAIHASCDFKNSYLQDGKVYLEGKAHFNYLGEKSDSDLQNLENSLDFVCTLPFSLGKIGNEEELRIEIDGGIRSADLVPDGQKLFVRFDVCGSVTIASKQHAQVLSQIQRGERKEKSGSGILYVYPEKGDTLWSLAKRHRTSPEKICEENSIFEENLPEVIRITR